MRLPEFDFTETQTLDEACRLMAGSGARPKLIAGGTDLMVNMKKGLVSPGHVVSISRLDELKVMERSGGVFKLGACVAVSDLAESDEINESLGALGAGARALGSPLIRNLATIGGNLASARPAADLPPSLMVYGSKASLASVRGVREASLDGFFTGPGLTEIQPDEILTRIWVDIPKAGSGAGYLNIGVRKAQDCNLVNAAAFIALDDDEKTIRKARVVMGCVGPTQLRSPAAENVLTGEKVSDKLFESAGHAAAGDAMPVDDFRGCAEYKKDMAGVLTRRALALALEAARRG
ncbi:Molybdopterin dehydrogenase [Candidatus Desulfarcum epimagneticum]|uniref:Molybdopterin dehydrogenase n=1 Tax=uncultured Desulfobacteraceae bacterium TaxID=218296 RepID=A0A484HDY0_9BACT|nr:Molybdopterin dehydrogenase [uncultured Desulfobacteraceae bacterium]